MYHLGILRMVRGSNEGSSDEWSDQRGFIMDSLSALASAMRNQAHNQVPTPEPSHHAAVLFEKFLKLDPPTFAGKPDPDAAENWILEVERVFQVLVVPEDKKTLYRYFQTFGCRPPLVGHDSEHTVPDRFVYSLGDLQKGFLGELFSSSCKGEEKGGVLGTLPRHVKSGGLHLQIPGVGALLPQLIRR